MGFSLVDVYSRACVAFRAAPGFKGADVVSMLQAAGRDSGGLPAIIQCDHGTEFTSVALDHWAYRNQVRRDFYRPGKPMDQCVCEAFNGSLTRECLLQHWFRNLTEAQQVLDSWRDEYNTLRPHSSLGQQHPRPNSGPRTTRLEQSRANFEASDGPEMGRGAHGPILRAQVDQN